MSNIWWVRHGPTRRREMNGWTDVPADLSDTVAIARMADYLPSDVRVVSSDLIRAVTTADAIQGPRPRLPHRAGLRELHFGDWEGRTYAEIEASDPELARIYWSEPGDVAAPGGESWNAMQARIDAEIADLRAEDTIIVAHFAVILSQVQHALGCSPQQVLAHKIGSLSVTHLRFDEGWRAEVINHHP